MGISSDHFFERFKWMLLVIGARVPNERIEALYSKTMHADRRDFDRAVEEMSEEERFSHATFREKLEKHRTRREENEKVKERMREVRETSRLRKMGDSGQQCLNRHCSSCKKTYCGDVTRAAVRAIFRIVDGQESMDDAHRRLAGEFPGLWDHPDVGGLDREPGEEG